MTGLTYKVSHIRIVTLSYNLLFVAKTENKVINILNVNKKNIKYRT